MLSSAHYKTAFGISAYGVKVGVRVTAPDAFGKLAPYLPIGWKPSSIKGVGRTYSIQLDEKDGSGTQSHHLYGDGRKLLSSPEEQSLLDSFESLLTIHVAEMAPKRVFVHAGVVGWRGRAIVIPGRSFSGKTTLVAALVRAGAVYYSDEYAVFDEGGRVHPYPRALHIRKPGEWRQTKCPAEKLGATVGKKPLPLGLVISTRFRDGAHFRPRQISAGLGVLELLNNTVSARRAPEAALDSFLPAVSQAKIFRSARADADEAAARLLEEMA